MKRRTFLKSLVAIGAAIASPSKLLAAKPAPEHHNFYPSVRVMHAVGDYREPSINFFLRGLNTGWESKRIDGATLAAFMGISRRRLENASNDAILDAFWAMGKADPSVLLDQSEKGRDVIPGCSPIFPSPLRYSVDYIA